MPLSILQQADAYYNKDYLSSPYFCTILIVHPSSYKEIKNSPQMLRKSYKEVTYRLQSDISN